MTFHPPICCNFLKLKSYLFQDKPVKVVNLERKNKLEKRNQLSRKPWSCNKSKLPSWIKPMLQCDLCKYKASEKGNMLRHMNSQHMNMQVSECKICKKVFADKFKLNYHLKMVHLDHQKYGCSICEKRYNVYKLLDSHIKREHPMKLMKTMCSCDICGVEYLSKLRLEVHIKMDHIGPFKCFDKKCRKSFLVGTIRRKHYFKCHSQNLEVRLIIHLHI